MSMNLDDHIGRTSNKKTILFKDGGVKEILGVIFMAGQLGPGFTGALAPYMVGPDDMTTLHNIWKTVKYNIRYRRDEPGEEEVKSPGKLVYDGHGDCKSFTVMVVSLLQNLGFKFKYRTAFYDPATPEQGHIYPVVMLGRREVIVDAVHKKFNEEEPYWRAYDYSPSGRRIASLSGFGRATTSNDISNEPPVSPSGKCWPIPDWVASIFPEVAPGDCFTINWRGVAAVAITGYISHQAIKSMFK